MLYIARGSLEESKNHLIFAKELRFVSDSDFSVISKIAEEIGLTLNGLRDKYFPFYLLNFYDFMLEKEFHHAKT